MKVDYLATELFPIGRLPRNVSSGVGALAKGIFTGDHVHENNLSYWQLVFLQSKANGCLYRGEDLPQINWAWPKKTWFQDKLSRHLKDLEFAIQPGGDLSSLPQNNSFQIRPILDSNHF